ncbi:MULTISPECIES: Na+/H+ antiporter NhaA [Protofrankia]|uniref:Na+/H+ antiporter NhaA n=1 Tax=Protofrankia TaxID=2994361 RepID=UPI0009F9C4F3|nr:MULTISPECIES: Na+/H+ antiporter NhaA [Protofrankia]
MAEPDRGVGQALAGRTPWPGGRSPLREFLRTETGGAAVLLAATLAALIWVNVAAASYETVWGTELSIEIGHRGVAQDLREWVTNGLMALFFFVVGLETRREFDIGELRERRRLALPVVACLAGMAVPVLIYLAVNAGEPSARGWGITMSTDTAFALGVLAVVGPRFPERLRTFLLTLTVVDDFVALVVIAVFYSEDVVWSALATGLGIFAVILAARVAGMRSGLGYAALGFASWVALLRSGIDPIVVGLAMGLLTYAHPAERGDLERATDLFRSFREQPTPELARRARVGVWYAISPNERLQQIIHPWTSYLVVPLFALANAGVEISGDVLGRALRSPVTLGIIAGYLLGKPVGIVGSVWLVRAVTHGRVRLPVGWDAITGAGALAGIGFTVPLLIATMAFTGERLAEAKIGILAAALAASVLSWIVFQVAGMLPARMRARAERGVSEIIIDLAEPVDPERDRIRGPLDAPVTLVEYGDFECPYCGRAEAVVRELLADFGDLRYVWRHLPLTKVHPHAEYAAIAVEAAAEQGAFWEMHDLLFDRQSALTVRDLLRYAGELGLDLERFRADLRARAGADRVERDIASADVSDVSGTPTFFINGRRHHGAYDAATLTLAITAARQTVRQ